MRRTYLPFVVLVALILAPACTTEEEPDTDSVRDTDRVVDTDVIDDTDVVEDTDIEPDTDEPIEPPSTDIELTEVGAEVGLSTSHWDVPDPFPYDCSGIDDNAAAAAVEDFDNDGDLDIFLARFDDPGILYANDGAGNFTDVTATSGITTSGRPGSATWVDVDGNGWLDLTITHSAYGYVELWMNQGDGTFLNQATVRGLALPLGGSEKCPSMWSAAYGDYDKDGDLDLVLGTWNTAPPGEGVTRNRLLQNDGSGVFADRTESSGWFPGYSLYTYTASWVDFNEDGNLDIALASDFLTNELWLSNGDGSFYNHAKRANVTDVENAMGSVIADFDGDGHLDWFITSIHEPRPEFKNHWGTSGNRLYLNNGEASFTDVSEAWHVRETGWAWGAEAVDLDHDTDLDLVVTNGRATHAGNEYLFEAFAEDPTTVYLKDQGRFWDVTPQVGVNDTGQGRAVIAFDMESDGDQDILVVNWGEPPLLYRNDTPNLGHWLRVRVRRPGTNGFGVGTVIWVTPTAGGPRYLATIDANSTFAGSGPIEAHFGLGRHEGTLHEVRAVYPEGTVQVLNNVEMDQLLTLMP